MHVTRTLAMRATALRRASTEVANPTVMKQRQMQNSHAHYQHERAKYWVPQFAGIRLLNISLTVILLNGMINVGHNRKEMYTPCWRIWTEEK